MNDTDALREQDLRGAGQRRGCRPSDPQYIGCAEHNSQWYPDFGCCYETLLLYIDEQRERAERAEAERNDYRETARRRKVSRDTLTRLYRVEAALSEKLAEALREVDTGWYTHEEDGVTKVRYASDLIERFMVARAALAEYDQAHPPHRTVEPVEPAYSEEDFDPEKTPYQRVVDDLTDGCGCACHYGTGYRSSCEHCNQKGATRSIVVGRVGDQMEDAT